MIKFDLNQKNQIFLFLFLKITIYINPVNHSKKTIVNIFCSCAAKIGAQKQIYFQRLHNSMETLKANISCEEHDVDNWAGALETTRYKETTLS